MKLGLEKKPVEWLVKNIDEDNIAPQLDNDILGKIGQEVVRGYNLDKDSRAEWEESTEAGLKIAMQVVETKTYPWPNAANVKFPLIATAAIQFASRAYSEIVRGKDIVRASVTGDDPEGTKEQRAKRIGEFMSYQLLEEMPEWEPDTDQMLHILPIVGCHFRKTYYSPLYQRNISEGVLAKHFVVNYKAKSLETCRRATHELYYYKNEILEKERFGIWLESEETDYDNKDAEKQELVLEQYCYLDLDGDGYEEPYIVTVHHDSQKVKRIAARYEESGITITSKGRRNNQVAKIDPVKYFTKYSFVPSPDGGFYDLGFARLLGPLNETINGLLNQLLDAGTLSNLQSGFISKGIRVRGGNYRFEPGEWKVAENTTPQAFKDALLPLPSREPSGVLFQLLGFLNENALKLASVSETMSGETPGANVPATTVLALIEQGLKVFTSIYKRIFRSLKTEYKLLYRLNSIYLPEKVYYRVLDNQKAIVKVDFEANDCDVEPIADPTQASEALRLAKARALMEIAQFFPLKEQKLEILKRYCQAIAITEIDKLFPEEQLKQWLTASPPPNPEIERIKLDTMKAEDTMRQKDIELKIKFEEVMARAELMVSQAQEAMAKAEATDIGHSFDQRALELNKMMHDFRMEVAMAMAGQEQQASGQPMQPQEQEPTSEGETTGAAKDVDIPSIDQAPIAGNQSRPDSAIGQPIKNAPGRPVALPES